MTSPPPPHPPAPGPRVRTVLLIVAAAVFVLVAAIAVAGVFAAGYVMHHVHISDRQADGSERVSFESPWGSLHVRSGEAATHLDMRVYPGATLVPADQPSAFSHEDLGSAGARSANVAIDFGGKHLRVSAAEFATPAPADAVIAFYRQELARHGHVEESSTSHDGVKLTVKVTDENVWLAVIRPWQGGTRFFLARVQNAPAD